MKSAFYELADHVSSVLKDGEVYAMSFGGETSDFVRFNKSAVRQPGRVTQRQIELDLIVGSRHASGTLTLTGDGAVDRERATALVRRLRDTIPHLPEDPHLLYATEVRSSEKHGDDRLPPPEMALESILAASRGLDLVGIYASGAIHSGFANSFGQRNWFTTHSFNFDWSFYHAGDKAVKCLYAGFEWDEAAFRAKVDSAKEQLAILAKPVKTIQPGRYRVFLSPGAVNELLGTLSWGGFGLKENRSRQSSLLKLIDGEVQMNPAVTIVENTAGGVAPDFQEQGFIKPPQVVLIEKGRYKDSLVSPRSAKEYGVPTNGAAGYEAPRSVEMAPGAIPAGEVLQRLDTGLHVSNLWYLNYSDRPACRITGMTRFATFWVEGGKIVAPLQVMRFDETIYRMFGEKLIGLTAERDMILDPDTYAGRSTGSANLPGALIEDFTFTL